MYKQSVLTSESLVPDPHGEEGGGQHEPQEDEAGGAPHQQQDPQTNPPSRGKGGGGHVIVLMYSDPDPTFDGFEFWIQTFEKIKQNLIFVC